MEKKSAIEMVTDENRKFDNGNRFFHNCNENFDNEI